MLRIRNLQVPFTDGTDLKELAAKRLGLPPQSVHEVAIVRKAVDARRYHGAPIMFNYVLDVQAANEKRTLERLRRDKQVEGRKNPPAKRGADYRGIGKQEMRPVVVGFGPAGMFAALALARAGWEPLVLERGRDVDTRMRDIDRFWQGGSLAPDSNVQFGEGGAGTFSDGKLTTRINDPLMDEVLADFIRAGAPEEISYLQKPHIGTDLLCGIVKRIREEIISLGGTVRFGARVTELETSGEGCPRALIVEGEERLPCDTVFLGIGHSARDTYRMLLQRGLAMEAKPFAMGVRIEHPQEFIDGAQYGRDAGDPRLPVADYALTYKDPATGRGAYSFCMCPGGLVVAATSMPGGVVTNGMSNYRRSSGVANSALLVQVAPADFGREVLAGMVLQESLEAKAFELGGGDYRAPVQTVGDFMTGCVGSTRYTVEPTYRPGVRPADLRQCLPDYITRTLMDALPYFDRKIPGFADAGVALTGVESRSSAPCRIRRDRETFEAERNPGIYPIGEGAGYAGGIMSAAVDGIRAAYAYLEKKNKTV